MLQTTIRQLFDKETGTFTYLVFDSKTKDAIIIDSLKNNVVRDLSQIRELNLRLHYILDTHVHADHVTGAYDLKKETNAQIVLGSEACDVSHVDIFLQDTESLTFGSQKITALHTPGHTNACTTYHIGDVLFTGDTLLVRSVGRTDFQNGDSEQLFESITRLYAFPDETIVYPGHNYEGFSQTTILEEKSFNKFITKETTKEVFVRAMHNRSLPLPKHIGVAVPSNMISGEKVIDS